MRAQQPQDLPQPSYNSPCWGAAAGGAGYIRHRGGEIGLEPSFCSNQLELMVKTCCCLSVTPRWGLSAQHKGVGHGGGCFLAGCTVWGPCGKHPILHAVLPTWGRSLQKGKKPWGCVVAVYPLRKRGLASTGRPSAPQRAFCRLLLAGGLGINPAGGSKVGWVMPLGSPSELCGAGACWEQPLVPTISPVGERVPARVQRAEVIWPFPKG